MCKGYSQINLYLFSLYEKWCFYVTKWHSSGSTDLHNVFTIVFIQDSDVFVSDSFIFFFGFVKFMLFLSCGENFRTIRLVIAEIQASQLDYFVWKMTNASFINYVQYCILSCFPILQLFFEWTLESKDPWRILGRILSNILAGFIYVTS